VAIFGLAFSMGVVAGLRAMTAAAALSWAARAGLLELRHTWLEFLGHAATPWILAALAIAELVRDQMPSTPSRRAPAPFGARLVVGAVAGAALGSLVRRWSGGMLVGVAGAVVGTLGGHAARAHLSSALGRDRPAALVEDAVAVAGASLIIAALT